MKNDAVIKNLDKMIESLFNTFQCPVTNFEDRYNLLSLTQKLQESIKDKIYALSKKLETKITKNEPIKDIEELISDLRKRVEIIDRKHFAYTHSSYLTNDEIDLYLDENSEPMNYIKNLIYNHKTKEYLGYITYEKPSYNNLGNISYFIDYMHRGNNYAYKALVLLTDELYKKGIRKINIATTVDNIASNKIIQKFGGIKIPYLKDKSIVMYKCDLKLIKNNKR